MQLNKYQERIIEIGQTKSAKLVLPERDDPAYPLQKDICVTLVMSFWNQKIFEAKKPNTRKF